MAVIVTPAPVKRGLVRKLRQSGSVTAAIVGGIHQYFAPAKARYPHITYQVITAPVARTMGSVGQRVLVDVYAWAENAVEAENLDALIAAALEDAQLDLDEQNQILCQRVGATPTGKTTDGRGRQLYQIGSTYEIWTDQPTG